MAVEAGLLEETKFNELFDFPISWDWHRYYSRIEIAEDPGSNVEVEDESTG